MSLKGAPYSPEAAYNDFMKGYTDSRRDPLELDLAEARTKQVVARRKAWHNEFVSNERGLYENANI